MKIIYECVRAGVCMAACLTNDAQRVTHLLSLIGLHGGRGLEGKVVEVVLGRRLPLEAQGVVGGRVAGGGESCVNTDGTCTHVTISVDYHIHI